MMHALDFRVLKAFLTVAREGNVTRASELLHLTQPGVTLQLKRLAAATGITLFRRTAAGLELTHDGAILAAKAEQVLNSLGDFAQTADNLATRVRGKLRVGTIIDPEFTRLGAFLKALIEIAPGIETTLRQSMSGDVIERLRRNELDAGFFLGDPTEFDPVTGISDDPSEGMFHDQILAQLTYRVIAPPSLAKLVRGADWPALAALPWIGTPPASAHHRLLARVFSELGLRQNKVAEVDQESSMIAMVRTGVGLSLCRETIALNEQQAHGLAIADTVRIPTTLRFVCANARKGEPTISAALNAIRRAWG